MTKFSKQSDPTVQPLRPVRFRPVPKSIPARPENASAPLSFGPGYGNEGLLAGPDEVWIGSSFVLAPLAASDSRRVQHYPSGAVVPVGKTRFHFGPEVRRSAA